ncbi:MAG: MBL fold metallo-hydrolase [Phyllobacteriaceae bacterium]|nr:MBL fold metallo-hydrolase [Phyllobacteriaceae bacterium]
MGQLSGVIVPVTAFQQNCAILFDDASKDGVVVDPGGDVPDILAAIDKAGVTINAIWLTHGHLDHAGGAMALKAALAVTLSPSSLNSNTAPPRSAATRM